MKKLSLVLVVSFFVSIVTYGQSCQNDGSDRVIEGETITYAPGGKITLKGGASAVGGSIILKPGDGMNGDGNIIMNLPSTSRVGIGTSSPADKLHVNGTIRMNGFKLMSGSPENGDVLTYVNGKGEWQSIEGGGGTSYWHENGDDDIYYDPVEGGNVGIGTDNPFEKLHVEGKVRIGGLNGTTNYGLLIDPIGVKFTSVQPGTDYMIFEVGGDMMMEIYNNDGNPYTRRVSFPNGNIGIGNNDPQSKLDVSGTITADEIEVQSDGLPDFVFQDNYKLMSLSKLEKHIKREKSLPGIPTNKEAIEKGVKVGDMQAKLLQKVEELTLYVIEQDKEIAELKERIAELEK